MEWNNHVRKLSVSHIVKHLEKIVIPLPVIYLQEKKSIYPQKVLYGMFIVTSYLTDQNLEKKSESP